MEKHVCLAQQNGFGLAFLQSVLSADKKAEHYGIQKRAIYQILTLGTVQIGPRCQKHIIILSPDVNNNLNPKPKY